MFLLYLNPKLNDFLNLFFLSLLPQWVKQDGRDSGRAPKEDSLSRPEFARTGDTRASITSLQEHTDWESYQLLPPQSLSAASPYSSHPGCFRKQPFCQHSGFRTCMPELPTGRGTHRDRSTITWQGHGKSDMKYGY